MIQCVQVTWCNGRDNSRLTGWSAILSDIWKGMDIYTSRLGLRRRRRLCSTGMWHEKDEFVWLSCSLFQRSQWRTFASKAGQTLWVRHRNCGRCAPSHAVVTGLTHIRQRQWKSFQVLGLVGSFGLCCSPSGNLNVSRCLGALRAGKFDCEINILVVNTSHYIGILETGKPEGRYRIAKYPWYISIIDSYK